MLSGIIGKAGRGVYTVLRKSAKLPLEVHNRVWGGDGPVVQTGSIYNHFEGETGERRYQRLCQDTALTLETIYYCQEEIGLLRKSLQVSRQLLNPNFDENEQKKRLINHDYLVLKVQPGLPNEPAFYLKAHKVAASDDGESKAGIHICYHEGFNDPHLERKCCLHRIDCGSARIGLGALIATLVKIGANYDIRNENCWDYARKATKCLLEECMKALNNEECKEYRLLNRQLKLVETHIVKNHTVNTVERGFKFAKTHTWDKLKS